jgi:hypothetical protein
MPDRTNIYFSKCDQSRASYLALLRRRVCRTSYDRARPRYAASKPSPLLYTEIGTIVKPFWPSHSDFGNLFFGEEQVCVCGWGHTLWRVGWLVGRDTMPTMYASPSRTIICEPSSLPCLLRSALTSCRATPNPPRIPRGFHSRFAPFYARSSSHDDYSTNIICSCR